MALPILDGNQSATTLSSVVTGGEHIVAHTVVSLGANAILDFRSAVSGSSVSISNFPSTQTIAGTVTANLSSANLNSVTIGVRGVVTSGISDISIDARNQIATAIAVYAEDNLGFPIRIANTDGTDISANLNNVVTTDDYWNQQAIKVSGPDGGGILIAGLSSASSLPANFFEGGGVPVFPRQDSGNFPISGTVTAAAPNGSLTTRFGTPTTANTAFATSAVTNANRKYLLIQNVTTGSNVITVGIGFTPTTTQGVQLTAGAGITFESSYIPTGAVYVLSSVTASNFTILEA